MSFNVEFKAASRRAAIEQVAKVTVPDCVREFAMRALSSVQDGEAVHVKLVGHLSSPGTYSSSNCTLEVWPFTLVKEAV